MLAVLRRTTKRSSRETHATPAASQGNHPKQFSHIRFLAHGTASRLVPLDSAILLSKDVENPESFKPG